MRYTTDHDALEDQNWQMRENSSKGNDMQYTNNIWKTSQTSLSDITVLYEKKITSKMYGITPREGDDGYGRQHDLADNKQTLQTLTSFQNLQEEHSFSTDFPSRTDQVGENVGSPTVSLVKRTRLECQWLRVVVQEDCCQNLSSYSARVLFNPFLGVSWYARLLKTRLDCITRYTTGFSDAFSCCRLHFIEKVS